MDSVDETKFLRPLSPVSAAHFMLRRAMAIRRACKPLAVERIADGEEVSPGEPLRERVA
jgi:hypothetical protein